MPGLSRKLDEVVRHAEAERAGYRQFLVDALSTERLSRDASAINTRIREAAFPEHKALGEFDFKATDGVDTAVIGQIATVAFVDNAENLTLIGPVGTGKAHRQRSGRTVRGDRERHRTTRHDAARTRRVGVARPRAARGRRDRR